MRAASVVKPASLWPSSPVIIVARRHRRQTVDSLKAAYAWPRPSTLWRAWLQRPSTTGSMPSTEREQPTFVRWPAGLKKLLQPRLGNPCRSPLWRVRPGPWFGPHHCKSAPGQVQISRRCVCWGGCLPESAQWRELRHLWLLSRCAASARRLTDRAPDRRPTHCAVPQCPGVRRSLARSPRAEGRGGGPA